MNIKRRLLSNSKLNPKTGCLEWQKFLEKGYGLVHIGGRQPGNKVWRVHRLMWTLEKGEIPAGKMIRHLCHNRACLNIKHLAIGTNQDNMNDMKNAGRQNKCKGSQHGEAKLSETAIPVIKRLVKAGKSYRAIGEIFGVQKAAIYKVIKGLSWRHVA